MYLLMLNSCDYIHSIIMESETKRFLLIHLHHPIQFCTVQLYSIWIHLHLQSAGNIRLVWLFKLILQSCSRGRCCYCNCECRHDSSWWLCSLKNHCSTWRGLVVGTTLHLYNMVYMKAFLIIGFCGFIGSDTAKIAQCGFPQHPCSLGMVPENRRWDWTWKEV